LENIVEADPDNWNQEVLKSDMLTAVYFWHERCPWCLRLNPIFSEIVEEYGDRIKFVRMNVLESPENPGFGHGSRGDGHANVDVFLSGKVTGANGDLYAERRAGESC
jgi:thiol-disulfide isomerase/thioredoxin